MDEQNPYAAPQAEEPPTDYAIEGDASIVRQGKKLLVPEGALLPTRCVSCNRPAQQELKVWAFRGSRRLLFRMLIMAAAIFATSLLMALLTPKIHRPLIPAVMPAAVALVMAVFHLRRHQDLVLFQFYICAKHQAMRYASLALLWLAVGAVVVDMWLPHLVAIELQIDSWFIFAVCGVAGTILAYATHVQIRASQGPTDPYVMHGFGSQYLNSFPSAVDLHVSGANKSPSKGNESEEATME